MNNGATKLEIRGATIGTVTLFVGDYGITKIQGGYAVVDSLEDDAALKGYLRACGVRAASTYVRFA